MHQDDPSKCTAAKLAKFRIVRPVRFIGTRTIVLNPFSDTLLTRGDAKVAEAVCAIDCSWEKAHEVRKRRRVFSTGIGRRLPAMLAANPVNYSKLGKLSSAEALAGAFYVLGDKDLASEILNKFKWGHTFLELNANLLEDYSMADKPQQVFEIERSYFPSLYASNSY